MIKVSYGMVEDLMMIHVVAVNYPDCLYWIDMNRINYLIG